MRYSAIIIGFVIICGPFTVLMALNINVKTMIEVKSHNEGESRAGVEGSWSPVIQGSRRNKASGSKDCKGKVQETPVDGVAKRMTRYCPDKEWKPEDGVEYKSGNYMEFKGVGKKRITIDFVNAERCDRHKPDWSEDCSCKGLLKGMLKKEITANVDTIDLIFMAIDNPIGACLCYLGQPKEDGFTQVRVEGCKGEDGFDPKKPIGPKETLKSTCDKILKVCKKQIADANKWEITKV